MSTALKYIPHYTLADYVQWQGDWELWEGVPVSMTPSPFGPHQLASMRLARQIGNQLERCDCGCEVLHEIDWVINHDTVIRPDLVVVCDGVPERHIDRPPVLVAEITSPATAHKDRTAKFRLYESQKVQYYLLVDPELKKLEIFVLDSAGKYNAVELSNSTLLELTPKCQVQINISSLWRTHVTPDT